MTMYMKKVRRLRLMMAGIGIALGLLLFSPTIALHTDAYANDAKPAATKVAPASQPAAAPTATAPAPAPAVKAEPAPASGDTQSWWQALLIPVLSALGLAIAAFLTTGLRKLTQLIEKKWNIDIPDSVEKLMAEKARWLIAWAEEKAETRLLKGDGVKTDGAKKLSDVVEALEKFAQNMGYGEEWRRDKIEQLVEGILHLERDQGVGSNGTDRGKKLEEKKNGNA